MPYSSDMSTVNNKGRVGIFVRVINGRTDWPNEPTLFCNLLVILMAIVYKSLVA